jgi:hypothetical protein
MSMEKHSLEHLRCLGYLHSVSHCPSIGDFEHLPGVASSTISPDGVVLVVTPPVHGKLLRNLSNLSTYRAYLLLLVWQWQCLSKVRYLHSVSFRQSWVY